MFGRAGNAVEFLADWQIGDALLRVVTQARQRLTLVSPYNRHWGHLKREVAAAHARGVAVTIYYRADEPSPLVEYDNVAGVPVRMLHAKIYTNESIALVTTMNLVETSATYSREVGFLVRDDKLRKEIDAYIASLVDDTAAPAGASARNAIVVRHQVATASDIVGIIDASGFCIECGSTVSFDQDRPLCPSCYSRHGRSSTHRYCHKCGASHTAQVNQPLCATCAATQAAGA